VNFLQRRRARFLIKRAQVFADEPLVAVAAHRARPDKGTELIGSWHLARCK